MLNTRLRFFFVRERDFMKRFQNLSVEPAIPCAYRQNYPCPWCIFPTKLCWQTLEDNFFPTQQGGSLKMRCWKLTDAGEKLRVCERPSVTFNRVTWSHQYSNQMFKPSSVDGRTRCLKTKRRESTLVWSSRAWKMTSVWFMSKLKTATVRTAHLLVHVLVPTIRARTRTSASWQVREKLICFAFFFSMNVMHCKFIISLPCHFSGFHMLEELRFARENLRNVLAEIRYRARNCSGSKQRIETTGDTTPRLRWKRASFRDNALRNTGTKQTEENNCRVYTRTNKCNEKP